METGGVGVAGTNEETIVTSGTSPGTLCVCVRVHIHVNSTAKPRYNCSLRQLMRYVACNIITTSLCQAPTTKVYMIWLQISLSATPSGRNGRAEFHTGYTNSKWPQWESRVPHRLHKLLDYSLSKTV